ncbi:hypothetical protein [Acidianus brierleyi]|nr:hypothetical protein [Acidianus brierleyi]
MSEKTLELKIENRFNELKKILPEVPENIQPVSSCGVGCGDGDKTGF